MPEMLFRFVLMEADDRQRERQRERKERNIICGVIKHKKQTWFEQF